MAENFRQVKEEEFDEFLSSMKGMLSARGNGSMGVDYYTKGSGELIAYFVHGMASNMCFIKNK